MPRQWVRINPDGTYTAVEENNTAAQEIDSTLTDISIQYTTTTASMNLGDTFRPEYEDSDQSIWNTLSWDGVFSPMDDFYRYVARNSQVFPRYNEVQFKDAIKEYMKGKTVRSNRTDRRFGKGLGFVHDIVEAKVEEVDGKWIIE